MFAGAAAIDESEDWCRGEDLAATRSTITSQQSTPAAAANLVTEPGTCPFQTSETNNSAEE